MPEIVEGDLASPGTVARALAGAGGLVVSVSAMTPTESRRMKAIEQDAVIAALDAAAKAGVDRVVLVSVYDFQQELIAKLRLETAGIKQAVEEHLARSSANWTVLGAPPSAARRLSTVYGREILLRRIPLLLPRMARALTRPLAPLSDRIHFVHTMTGFVQLLNHFPAALAAEAPADHQRLHDLFRFTATTLEMEARRRGVGGDCPAPLR